MGKEIWEVFDNITYLFLYSPEIYTFYKKLANETKTSITVWNGDASSFSHYKNNNVDLPYREGLNILLSCSSASLTKDLNKKYNKDNKSFIGFGKNIHTYGNNIYSFCGEGPTLMKIKYSEKKKRIC